MGHDVDGPGAEPVLAAPAVEAMAETLQALGSPSRLRILLRLRESACAVGELAEQVGMEQSAVSHQLRVLRHLGFVVGVRDGRSVRYRLHDDHVAQLLDEAAYHVEHLRSGVADG